MTIPAEPNDGSANPASVEGSAATLALEIRDRDLELRIRAARRRERRSAVWAFLGISPAAIIPGLGLFLEHNFGLLILLGFLVTLTQLIRMGRAGGEARALESELGDLRAGE